MPYETLKIMRDNGLRLLLVGYETGSQQILCNIRKGMRLEFARRFSEDCHKLGITVHGTFILGLPGETQATIEETIRFARDVNPHTIQVSLAAAYPGTELYRQAQENDWLLGDGQRLVSAQGIQISSLGYPHLSRDQIFAALGHFYKRFYFRPGKMAELAYEMIRSPEGVEFFRFLAQRGNHV